MNRTNYILLGLIVLCLTTLINLSQSKAPSRGWSSYSSGSGWSSGGSHK